MHGNDAFDRNNSSFRWVFSSPRLSAWHSVSLRERTLILGSHHLKQHLTPEVLKYSDMTFNKCSYSAVCFALWHIVRLQCSVALRQKLIVGKYNSWTAGLLKGWWTKNEFVTHKHYCFVPVMRPISEQSHLRKVQRWCSKADFFQSASLLIFTIWERRGWMCWSGYQAGSCYHRCFIEWGIFTNLKCFVASDAFVEAKFININLKSGFDFFFSRLRLNDSTQSFFLLCSSWKRDASLSSSSCIFHHTQHFDLWVTCHLHWRPNVPDSRHSSAPSARVCGAWTWAEKPCFGDFMPWHCSGTICECIRHYFLPFFCNALTMLCNSFPSKWDFFLLIVIPGDVESWQLDLP